MQKIKGSQKKVTFGNLEEGQKGGGEIKDEVEIMYSVTTQLKIIEIKRVSERMEETKAE